MIKSNNILRAGIAKSDITTDAPDAVIADRLYAKALVIDDGNTKLVIITMDVTAIGGRHISAGMLPDIGEAFLPELRFRIEQELGISGCNVLVNASHTHPSGKMLCDDEQQIERTFDAVRRATQNMDEVKIGSGYGIEDRISMNRTLRLKNGLHWSLRHTNPSPPDDEIAGTGPVDYEIGVLRIDRLDGSPLAVVYNFACHLLFGNTDNSISANLPGYASELIEQTLKHGALAFFVQGAAGDIIDINFENFRQPRDVKDMGMKLGQSVLDAYQNIEPENLTLDVISKTIMLPRRTDVPEKVAKLKQQQAELLESLRFTTLNFDMFMSLRGSEIDSGMDAINQKNMAKYLQNIRAMEQLARIEDKIATLEKHRKLNDESGSDTIAMEVQAIRIGEAVLIASPAELLAEIGLNLKKASPFKYTLVAGYSNGYMHYGAPASYYDKGGYEVTESLLGSEWQQIFERASAAMLHNLRNTTKGYRCPRS